MKKLLLIGSLLLIGCTNGHFDKARLDRVMNNLAEMSAQEEARRQQQYYQQQQMLQQFPMRQPVRCTTTRGLYGLNTYCN